MTLTAWWNKVRPGGLISGDDYGDMEDTRSIKASRWALKFGRVAMDKQNKWGVFQNSEKCLPGSIIDLTHKENFIDF